MSDITPNIDDINRILNDNSEYYLLYIVSAPLWLEKKLVKLGLTTKPFGRNSTYLTGCPPKQSPSAELTYYKIWKIKVNSVEELKKYETILHDQFQPFRMYRDYGKKTEWFDFKDKDPIQTVVNFMSNKKWVEMEVELTNLKRNSIPLVINDYNSNLINFINDTNEHYEKLSLFQEPHIKLLEDFIENPNILASLLVAPCGYGKTVVASKAIKNILKKILICVPTDYLKDQWTKELIKFGEFSGSDIHYITNEKQFKEVLKKDRFIIIICYASTNNIINALDNSIELAIFDEAHRLSGIVKDDDNDDNDIDIGATKRLIIKCKDLSIKRLSLTFTPKIVNSTEETLQISSNDDVNLFGEVIINIGLREMIKNGLLPDYRIHMPEGKDKSTIGLKGKVKLISHAILQKDNDEFIINHLIVFGKNHNECILIEKYLKEYLDNSIPIYYLDKSNTMGTKIQQFNNDKRSILINCKLLGEGVDIPIADSVTILYPKKSFIEIIQMLLRAGRFYLNKSVFHIILPQVENEDNEGIQNALHALSSVDILLSNEIVKKSLHYSLNSQNSNYDEEGNIIPDTIVINSYNSDEIEKIRNKSLEIIKKNKSFQYIRDYCVKNRITCIKEYNNIRERLNWDGTPWKDKMTAYDFFHPDSNERISVDIFKELMINQNIPTTDRYIEWRLEQTLFYPTVEEAIEGYFHNISNFQDLLPQSNRRR